MITIARADLSSEISQALIRALNAELSGAYAEPAGFHPIPLYGEYRLSPDTSVCLGKELPR